MLRLEGIRKAFGDLQVLDGVDLTLTKGEVVVLVGRSGAGKSTLIRCVNLIETPEDGIMRFQDMAFQFGQHHKLDRQNVQKLRKQIGMVFQHFNLWPHLTALGNITLALEKAHDMPSDEAKERAIKALEREGLHDKIDAYPGTLSGGQKQRVAIARALATQPNVMLFDEVTSALDPELVQGILKEIIRLARAGMTMIVVTHEMEFAQEVGDRLIFMDGGIIVEEGPPREMVSNPKHPETQKFLGTILQ
ncbi:MAG: amino acid ABC transporter ATP-binding protein [Chloroflexi bacterium]|nr:amino acid ABC transporter ATP-binding protein [Chloroflexota bacterium]